MKRTLLQFVAFWVGLFVLTFFTADDLPFLQRLLYTGVMAFVALILSLTGGAKSKPQKKATPSSAAEDMDIHLPLDPKALYRVRGGKIYKGMDAAPTYEIKGDKIHPVLSSKFVYRIENNKIYRGMEPAPFLEIKGKWVHPYLDSKYAYEIRDAATK